MQVHFLNWSDKHDQTLPCTSSRIRLPPSNTNDVHDFVEAPSMVPASCRTLAEVTAFKRVCDKEEESGVRKSGRRRAVEADDDADRAEAPGGEEAVPVPSINSGGMYVAASKKRAMNAMVVTTRGLPSRAVALARRALEHHARPVLGRSEQPASQAAGAGGGAAAAGLAPGGAGNSGLNSPAFGFIVLRCVVLLQDRAGALFTNSLSPSTPPFTLTLACLLPHSRSSPLSTSLGYLGSFCTTTFSQSSDPSVAERSFF